MKLIDVVSKFIFISFPSVIFTKPYQYSLMYFDNVTQIKSNRKYNNNKNH